MLYSGVLANIFHGRILYILKESWGSTHCRKDKRISCQMIWACVEKPCRSPNKESRSDKRVLQWLEVEEDLKKIIDETIKRDLNFNGLNVDMVYDKAVLHHCIHVVDPTQWDKSQLLYTYSTPQQCSCYKKETANYKYHNC